MTETPLVTGARHRTEVSPDMAEGRRMSGSLMDRGLIAFLYDSRRLCRPISCHAEATRCEPSGCSARAGQMYTTVPVCECKLVRYRRVFFWILSLWKFEASMSNPRIEFQLSSERPMLAPPGGKPLVVHIVANIEHWPFDRPMPRQIFTPPHGIPPKPDVPNFSWAEYGMRCGLPRIADLLRRLAVPASAAINASVFDIYPSLAKAVDDAGWELMGHGYFQRTLQQERDERQVIRDSVERLRRQKGKRVRGWLGPGLHETDNTPEFLKEAGIDYVCDWALDDLPCWMTTKRGPLIAMPYAIELNDTVMYSIDKQGSDEMLRRVKDTVVTLEPELGHNPRVLTMALHPYAIGVPHRLPYLGRAIEFLKARDDTVFMTGSEIADWFVSADAASRGHGTA